MLTWELRIPIRTVRFPLASGRELTVPVRFMLRTLTDSPSLKSDALCSFFGFCAFIADADAVSLIFLRSFSRSFSISAAEMFSLPNLRKSLIVLSATSFASRRMAFAFSFASRKMRSRWSSNFSWRCFAWAFRSSASFFNRAISSCSFSIVRLLVSRSVRRSSKETSCSLSRFFASSII